MADLQTNVRVICTKMKFHVVLPDNIRRVEMYIKNISNIGTRKGYVSTNVGRVALILEQT